MVRTLLSSLPRLHVVASAVLCSVFKFYLTIFTFLLFHLVLNLFPSPLLTLSLTFPSCSVCYFLSHVIVLAAHNESGEIVVARSVKEVVAARLAILSVTSLTHPVYVCWVSHGTVFFIFTSVCFCFFFHLLSLSTLRHLFISLCICSCAILPLLLSVSWWEDLGGLSFPTEEEKPVQLASKWEVC